MQIQGSDVLGVGESVKQVRKGFLGLLDRLDQVTHAAAPVLSARRDGKALDAKVDSVSRQVSKLVETVGCSQREAMGIALGISMAGKKLENLEATLKLVEPMVCEDSDASRVGDALLFEWTDAAQHEFDDAGREMLAKLLAGEVDNPGTFTKSLVATISKMETPDLELFRNVCSASADFGDYVSPVIFHFNESIGGRVYF